MSANVSGMSSHGKLFFFSLSKIRRKKLFKNVCSNPDSLDSSRRRRDRAGRRSRCCCGRRRARNWRSCCTSLPATSFSTARDVRDLRLRLFEPRRVVRTACTAAVQWAARTWCPSDSA